MFTKEALLSCSTAPNINSISLELYKEFSEEYLIPNIFHYDFLDGASIDIEFTEWGIYHMLSIQHIDRRVKKTRFFSEIERDYLSIRSERTEKRIRDLRKKKRELQCLHVYIMFC